MTLSLFRQLLSTCRSPMNRPGEVPVEIDSLVSPLRYDIIIRLQYFRFFADQRQLFATDFTAYFKQALRHPYFTWFHEIFCRRFRPDLLDDRPALLNAFAERLLRSADLFDSFAATGFDTKRPITLRSGLRISPTDSGKLIVRSFYPGNGCHRIALLMARGETVLAPNRYRFQSVDRFQPLDNTARLLSVLGISPEEYFSFIGRGYGYPEANNEARLLGWVRQRYPGSFQEIVRTVEADRPIRSGNPNGVNC
jgi:hypothetical protein